MPGTRKTFARVDVLLVLLDLLGTAEALSGVDLIDTQLNPTQSLESIFAGLISGDIGQPVSAAGRTRDQDEFTIPLHISAENIAAQATSTDARRRCEALMNAVRDTVATSAPMPSVAGLIDLVVVGADGPDPEPVAEPAGWVAYGTVRVRARVRMI